MAAQEVVIGVDFGTTNSVVAVLKPDGVEVLANDIDKRSTPSCVYVKDGEREVGEAALRWATCYPANIIRNVKSVLGHPLNSITGRHQLGAVTIGSSPCEKSITVTIEGVRTLPIEEIAAMVLREMKKIATMQLDGEVEKAVIAVPSYFRASQRRAVMDSAYLAGLEAVELVNETTAAAAAYAHDREDSKTVIIVDIGGGGSSASIVKVHCNTVEVLAHSGTRLPGGDDFDAKMVEHLKECVKNESKVEVDDPRDCEILLSHWRKAKEKLSRIPHAVIAVFLPSCKREFKHEVKRVEFEAICGEMFGEISKGLQKLQDSCKEAASAAEEVLLIGGSSRIPHLRALVLKVLNKAKALSKAINPDEAVAEGAALLAAKCVVLKQEVLALRTELTINDDVVIRHPNSVLPFYQEVPSKMMSFWWSTIEVSQETNNGLMFPILCKSKRKDIGSIEITESGILCVRDSKRGEKKFNLDGCIAPFNLAKYRKRLEAHTKTELDELSRVESKNALEKLLRVERGKEVSADDWYYKDIMELQNECEKHLTWLSEHSNESASKYDELRSEVEDKIATLNSKLEYESNRVQAEKCLRETLLATAEADIPQDPFQVKALELKALCYKKLRELEEKTRLSTEELDQELQIILQKTEDLATKRMRHASEQRSLKARELLEETILTAHQTWKTEREQVDAAIFAAHDRTFSALYQTVTQWLTDRKALKNGEAEFNRERESFESEFSLIKNRLLKDIKSAEESRQRCYKATREKIEEALSIELPKHDDPLYELTKKYNDKWAASLKWLSNNPSCTMSKYVMLTKSIDGEVQDLRHAQALQKERVRYKNLIDEKLANGYEEFKDSLLCNLRSAFHKWLNENPQAANTSLEQYSARVAEVVQGFHTAKSHQLNQERESAAAKQAYEKAAADSKKLLSDFGFTDAPPCQAGSCCRAVWSSPSVPYAPADFTKSVAEEKMDIENDIQPQLNHFAEENRGREKQSTATGFLGSGAAVDEQTMVALWKLVQQPTDQQWSLLDPASPQSQVVQLMLECLAEELAVAALSSAGMAGCMALLLDRESTPGKDLVSLSVRYVGSFGRAEERLLLVLDRKNFSESAQDFARRVFEHFKALCGRAHVNWPDCLRYLSVPACGDFAPCLASFLRGEGCRGLQQVDSISNPLDNRIAVESYRKHFLYTESHTLITFFSTVDTLRQKLSFGSKWFPLLADHCKIKEGDDPWLTYNSSVAFMLAHRTEISELLARVSTLDPRERVLMDSLTDKMKEFSFISCLVAFDGIFDTVLLRFSDVSANPSSEWKSFLSRLESNEGVLLNLSFKDALVERIRTTTGQYILPRSNPVHLRVQRIFDLVIDVVRHTLESFQDCLYVKTCLDPPKSVSNRSSSYNTVLEQLSSLKRLCPTASFDSPECVLRLTSRERQPELFVALQRALTVPLIPPRGQRSAEQLREAVRNTAAILPVVGLAALPLAVRADPPLAHTVARAVARANARCLELASSDCSMETEV